MMYTAGGVTFEQRIHIYLYYTKNQTLRAGRPFCKNNNMPRETICSVSDYMSLQHPARLFRKTNRRVIEYKNVCM